MHLKRVTIHTGEYPVRDCNPFNLPVLGRTRSLSFETPVTLFAGENGAGKSTLLEAISRACGIYIWQDTDKNRYQYIRPGAAIYSFDLEQIQQTTYEETTHYKLYKSFLENRDQYLFPGK